MTADFATTECVGVIASVFLLNPWAFTGGTSSEVYAIKLEN